MVVFHQKSLWLFLLKFFFLVNPVPIRKKPLQSISSSRIQPFEEKTRILLFSSFFRLSAHFRLKFAKFCPNTHIFFLPVFRPCKFFLCFSLGPFTKPYAGGRKKQTRPKKKHWIIYTIVGDGLPRLYMTNVL